jgi:adenosylhomocysteine nucleosidase
MLRFVVALQAEARPLMDRFRMEMVHEEAFRIYRGEEGAWLAVSGHGKAAAAAAAAYLHLYSGGALGRVWLNVGIGGHSRRPVGEGVIAHKVTDHASGLSWYPQLVVDSPGPTVPLLTIERVEEEYSPPWVYETEAAGFVPTACRFSLAELVHCYKVISDNPDATLSRRMSSAYVEDLIQKNLEGIEGFARSLAGLAREMEVLSANPPGYVEILERWHFNAAQQRRLHRLLQRLAVLDPEGVRAGFDLTRAREGRDVLWALETRLAEIPVRLPVPGGVETDVVC